MPDVLRPFLLGLVLLNLVFVQITDAVSAGWLAPLYGLTLINPMLVRFQRSLVYRSIWNLAVLGIFAVLVRHALTSGLLHMLEDGLILAALCQVHLLNNLGPRQRPDLLFFNSFLIAFVTSFFCQDLAFSIVFALYVLLLLPSMQLYCVMGGEAVGRVEVARVLRDSAPRTLLALGATALLFALFPRDFEREGWIGAYADLQRAGNLAVGFSEEVQLGRSGETTLSDREVMRIRVLEGHRGSVPMHWRGATFVDFTSRGWSAEADVAGRRYPLLDPPWREEQPGHWRRDAVRAHATLEVELVETLTSRLFLPLQASRLDVADSRSADSVSSTHIVPLRDGTALRIPEDNASRVGKIRYRVTVSESDRVPPSIVSLFATRRLRALHPRYLPRELLELAARLDSRLPPQPDQETLVEAYRSWLALNLEYKLPGTKGAARNLGEFLSGDAGGHCEYFATALAFMLRSREIPCRLVTGFLASEWDADKNEVVVRRRHAHAWVEVFDPQRGWVTVDATPATAADAAEHTSWWASLKGTLEDWWNSVTGFDAEGRARAWAWLTSLPGRLGVWLSENPMSVAGLLFGIALLIFARRLRRLAGLPQCARRWRRCVRRLGLRQRSGETPRELVTRAGRLGLPPGRIADLERATHAHELQRYRL